MIAKKIHKSGRVFSRNSVFRRDFFVTLSVDGTYGCVLNNQNNMQTATGTVRYSCCYCSEVDLRSYRYSCSTQERERKAAILVVNKEQLQYESLEIA